MTNIVVPQIGHCHVAQVAEEGLGGAGAAESAARSCRHNEAVGEKAEVSDTHEALRQHVKKESPQELGCGQGHGSLLAVVSVVLPTEGDALAIEAQQSMVGNGHPVCVPAQIADHLHRITERRLGVNHPILAVHAAEEFGKLLVIGQKCCRSGTADFLAPVESL